MNKEISKIKLGGGTSSGRLKLLCVIVNREKAEFYIDLVSGFEVNLQAAMLARCTADTEMLNLLGLDNNDKAVILGVIREDRTEAALDALKSKFETIKNGKGIAFTVPLTSTIGVAVYRFLANNRGGSQWNTATK